MRLALPAGERLRALARGRRVWIVAACLLAASPVREVVRALGRDRAPGTPADALLAPLVAALPASGPIGWAAAAPKPQREMEARIVLQYAAAPRVVVDATRPVPVVVAWAAEPEALDRLLRARGLRAVTRFAAGYVLCTAE